MKALSVFLFASLIAVRAQTPAAAPKATLPDLPDETEVCTFDDGLKFTMLDFKKVYASLPPQLQQMAIANRQEFLNEYNLMRKLTKLAEARKLDQDSPYKEALDFSRMMVLSQAQMMEVNREQVVTQADIVKDYDVNKEKYKQARVKAIYVGFGNASARKLTEDAAKAKAVKLAAAARSGGDFVKLVKENSEDETSRGKDGDFGSFRMSDNIPDAIRATVFALNQGDVSDPVRQPNGFYVFRAEEVAYRPLSQVRDEIFTALKMQHYQRVMDKINQEAKVKNINPAFLGAAPVGK